MCSTYLLLNLMLNLYQGYIHIPYCFSMFFCLYEQFYATYIYLPTSCTPESKVFKIPPRRSIAHVDSASRLAVFTQVMVMHLISLLKGTYGTIDSIARYSVFFFMCFFLLLLLLKVSMPIISVIPASMRG